MNKQCKQCGGFCPTGTLENGLCLDCDAKQINHPCKWCEVPVEGDLVTGSYLNGRHGRRAFRGYLCQQHAQELDNMRAL